MPFIRFMGIVPLGIGLTLLIALWSPNSPVAFAPIFFKIIGSFIACSFVAMGAGAVLGKLTPRNQLRSLMSELRELQQELGTPLDNSQRETAGYQCPGCGAQLQQGADVSPHGDVKCNHCGRWFNIHQG